jgi:hypothetical protein
MKITVKVPGFVTEENVQEAVKRCRMKGVPLNPPALAGAAIALGLQVPGFLEQLNKDAAALSLDPSAPSLPQEQLDFIKADAASRGIDTSEFMKEFTKFAPGMMKLMSQHPIKEISVTLPEETH